MTSGPNAPVRPKVPPWKLPDGTDHDGYFGPGSMMWTVYRSKLVGLAGSRAVVMQLSRPHVAQAVADYSIFEENPLPRARTTFSVVHRIVFGTIAEADAALGEVGGKHRPIKGWISRSTAGKTKWAGTTYSPGGGPNPSQADRDSRVWVVSTIADTTYRMHQELFGTLTPAEAEQLWQEWRKFGALFGVDPSQFPATYADFQAYVSGMLGDQGNHHQALVVEARTVRRLSKRLFRLWLSRLLASGVTTWVLLPERMRPLVAVWPRFAVETRGRMALGVIRLIARFGPRRMRLHDDYGVALWRLQPQLSSVDTSVLTRQEVRLSRSRWARKRAAASTPPA